MHYSCLRDAPCLIRRSPERSGPRASRPAAILIAAAQTRSRSKYSERNPLKYGARPLIPMDAAARTESACVIVIIRDVIRLAFFFIFCGLCNGCVIKKASLYCYSLIGWFGFHLIPLHEMFQSSLQESPFFKDAIQ